MTNCWPPVTATWPRRMRLYAATAPGATLEDDGRLLLYSTSRDLARPVSQRGHAPRPFPRPRRRPGAGAAAFFADASRGTACGSPPTPMPTSKRARSRPGTPRSRPRGPRASLSNTASTAGPSVPAGVTLDEVTDDDGTARLPGGDRRRLRRLLPAPRRGRGPAGHACGPCGDPTCAPWWRADEGRPWRPPWWWRAAAWPGSNSSGPSPAPGAAGLGELCTRWAVAAGFDLGAQAIVLEASEAGEPLYLRLGFVEVSRYRWCFGPPARRSPS